MTLRIQNDMAMIPHSKMDGDIWETFKSVRNLRNTNDFALFSSACCRSNLEITAGMIRSGKFGKAQTSEFRSMETMLRGYIESSAVLRQRIENTVELVCFKQINRSVLGENMRADHLHVLGRIYSFNA